MARRSPSKDVAVVNQKYDIGCTWRMFRIFSFRECHSDGRLISNRSNWNTHATGNGNSRGSSDVPRTVDRKYPHIGVSSRRRRDCGCKSIGCVENDQIADLGNEVTKMIVGQKFVNKNYQGKDEAGCEPNQFFDALQILYSNKELFLKLLHDPNSVLVKQVRDLQRSQVEEPYQARPKRMTRLNNSHNSNAGECVKPSKSFDRYDTSSSCEPQSSNRILVLKPGTTNVQNFADTGFDCPQPHSPSSFSNSVQNIKPSHFPFGRIKRKLRHIMRVRKEEQQWKTIDGVPYKFPCASQGLEDGNKLKELEIAGRNSLTNVPSSIGKSLDLKKIDKSRVKGSELCIRQKASSFGESRSRNTNNTLVSPSSQNTLNIHVEGRKSLSEMLNCGIQECNQWTNTPRRTVPLSDFDSFPSLQSYWEHGSVTERMGYFPNTNYEMDLRTKVGVQKDGESSSFSSTRQNIKDPPGAIVKATSHQLQLYGTDFSIRKSPPDEDLHAHDEIPRDGGYKDCPTQNLDINKRGGRIESFLDSHPGIHILSFSPEVASSPTPSTCQRTEDTVNMRSRVEHTNIDSVVEPFSGENVINLPITISQPDELPVQVVHDKFEEHHFADLIRSSLHQINNLTYSMDILDNAREILQAFIPKYNELVVKGESSDQLVDPLTFDEPKGLIGQLCGDTILFDCINEAFMDLCQNCGFPPYISTKEPNIQAYVVKKILVKEITELINLHFLPYPSPITLQQLVEKDLARRGSWLNIQVDIQDVAIEVEEDVLEKLILEIVCETDIRSTIHCNMCMA